MPSIHQPRRPRASPLWQIVTAAWDAFLAGMKTATDTLLESFRARLNLPDGRLAAVAAVHTFGDYLFFHPHLHVLAADGLFDSEGRFHCMPADSRAPMIELFRNRFLQALRDGKHVSPSRLADLLSWKHCGFHIDGGGENPVASHDADGRKRLAEYLLRHPFSLQKITWNATTQTVIYRSKRHHTTKRNFEIFKASDFIAAVNTMKTTTLTTFALLAAWSAALADDGRFEGGLKPFLGEPRLEIQQVFKRERLPNVVVATDGSVVAAWGWGEVCVRRSDDGGKTWAPEMAVGKGLLSGGVTVDGKSGDILLFTEAKHPPAPLTMYRSRDHGKTWKEETVTIQPDSKGNVPSMCMNEHGIALRHGDHKGRLLRPARCYGKSNARNEWPTHYTTAVYSDDGGKTWLTSEPFPAMGTGEATVAELSDGRIYYNSRRHWTPEGVNNLTRWTAWSDDGGATWKNLAECTALPDGPQNTGYGLMAGLVRLPIKDKDILLFSNTDSPNGRSKGTVWSSFDGGKTWPLKRLVTPGAFAYSSLDAGRPGTPSEGWIYLLFEGGGGQMARFNLSWLLQGEKTGNGEVPQWVLQSTK